MMKVLRILLLAMGGVLITVGVVAMYDLFVSPATRIGPGWLRANAIVIGPLSLVGGAFIGFAGARLRAGGPLSLQARRRRVTAALSGLMVAVVGTTPFVLVSIFDPRNDGLVGFGSVVLFCVVGMPGIVIASVAGGLVVYAMLRERSDR